VDRHPCGLGNLDFDQRRARTTVLALVSRFPIRERFNRELLADVQLFGSGCLLSFLLGIFARDVLFDGDAFCFRLFGILSQLLFTKRFFQA
jgi:hypothetical protein